MALLARFVFLLSMHSINGVSSSAHGMILPADCEGATGGVISCDGVDSTSGTMDAATWDLGRKLNNSKVKLVRVYVKLNVSQTVYVPGKAADGSNEETDTSLSLAFVYGKSEKFTSAYLFLPLPSRYYSAGWLSRDVRWRAKDNQTLLLSVNSDLFGYWNNSGRDERRSLIYTAVREALTASIRRYTDDNSATLTGELLVRGGTLSAGVSHFYLLYGRTFKYFRCSPPPPPQGVDSNCSHWEEVTASTLFGETPTKWVSSIFSFYVYTLFFAILIIYLLNKSRNKGSKGEATSSTSGNDRVYLCTRSVPKRSVDDLCFLDSRFPERLRYPFVLFTHKYTEIVTILLFFVTDGCILSIVYKVNISLAEDFAQDADNEYYTYAEPLVYAKALFGISVLLSVVLFFIFVSHFFIFISFTCPKPAVRFCQRVFNDMSCKLKFLLLVYLLISSILLALLSLIPFTSNAVFVILFASISAAAVYNVTILAIVGILKFVLVDVLDIATSKSQFYETVFSDIFYEKKAVDSQLKRRVRSETDEHTKVLLEANVVDVREDVFSAFHRKRHPNCCVKYPGPYVLFHTFLYLISVLGYLLVAFAVFGSMQALLVNLNDLTGTSWSAVYSYILPAVLIIAPAARKAATQPPMTSDDLPETVVNEGDKVTIEKLISEALEKIKDDRDCELSSPL